MRRVVILLSLLLVAAKGSEQPPNIVLFMAEDLSPRIGAYGDSLAQTPNVDALAREGRRYTRAFTTAGVCAPSRAAIIMGVHQGTWGAGHMRAAAKDYVAVPPAEWKAFPELLRAAGYYTVTNGKTDYQMSSSFGGAFGGPSSIWDEERGEDWRGRAVGQPFFLYYNLNATHESQVWPTWMWPRDLISWLLWPLRVLNHLQWPLGTDPEQVVVPPYYPDTATVRADMARHYNNIAVMDAEVGAVLAKLEEDGLADDTLVVFMTDHGDGLPRAKRWTYDSGLHVPLVVRWPERVAPSEVNGELVSGVDLAPTFLSLAGASVPEQMQGRTFLGPDPEPEPDFVYAARDRMDEASDTVRAVRSRRWKYIRNFVPDQPYVLDMSFRNHMPMMREMIALDAEGDLQGPPALWFQDSRPADELYDTDSDPHEIHNLAEDPAQADRLGRMRGELDRWLADSGDMGLLPEDEIAAQFWPGGQQPVTSMPVLRFIEESDGVRLEAHSTTEGASIEISVNEGSWEIYTRPVAVLSGALVSARAVRYGWAQSGEVSAVVPKR